MSKTIVPLTANVLVKTKQDYFTGMKLYSFRKKIEYTTDRNPLVENYVLSQEYTVISAYQCVDGSHLIFAYRKNYSSNNGKKYIYVVWDLGDGTFFLKSTKTTDINVALENICSEITIKQSQPSEITSMSYLEYILAYASKTGKTITVKLPDNIEVTI